MKGRGILVLTGYIQSFYLYHTTVMIILPVYIINKHHLHYSTRVSHFDSQNWHILGITSIQLFGYYFVDKSLLLKNQDYAYLSIRVICTLHIQLPKSPFLQISEWIWKKKHESGVFTYVLRAKDYIKQKWFRTNLLLNMLTKIVSIEILVTKCPILSERKIH